MFYHMVEEQYISSSTLDAHYGKTMLIGVQKLKTSICINNCKSIKSIINADDAFPIEKSQVNRLNVQFSPLSANVDFWHF